jgi:hypothetical protein
MRASDGRTCAELNILPGGAGHQVVRLKDELWYLVDSRYPVNGDLVRTPVESAEDLEHRLNAMIEPDYSAVVDLHKGKSGSVQDRSWTTVGICAVLLKHVINKW